MIKNSKKAKKILVLICMCMVSLLIYEIIHIYAVFYSEIEGNVVFEKGTWNIYVNDTDISEGIEKEFIVQDIKVSDDEHVKPGNLAPGLSGSFEISINPKDTNVSVRYDITLEKFNNENVKIKSIKETEYNNTLVRTEDRTYTGIIPLDKIQEGAINKINIEVEWVDDGTNDIEDTKLASDFEQKLQIPIKVNVSQYLGETITPYIEN